MAAGPVYPYPVSSSPERGERRIRRKAPPVFPYSAKYPAFDPHDPLAPLSVLRGRVESGRRPGFTSDSDSAPDVSPHRANRYLPRSPNPRVLVSATSERTPVEPESAVAGRRRSRSVLVSPVTSSPSRARARLGASSYPDLRASIVIAVEPASPAPMSSAGPNARHSMLLPGLDSNIHFLRPSPPPSMTSDDSSASDASTGAPRRRRESTGIIAAAVGIARRVSAYAAERVSPAEHRPFFRPPRSPFRPSSASSNRYQPGEHELKPDTSFESLPRASPEGKAVMFKPLHGSTLRPAPEVFEEQEPVSVTEDIQPAYTPYGYTPHSMAATLGSNHFGTDGFGPRVESPEAMDLDEMVRSPSWQDSALAVESQAIPVREYTDVEYDRMPPVPIPSVQQNRYGVPYSSRAESRAPVVPSKVTWDSARAVESRSIVSRDYAKPAADLAPARAGSSSRYDLGRYGSSATRAPSQEPPRAEPVQPREYDASSRPSLIRPVPTTRSSASSSTSKCTPSLRLQIPGKPALALAAPSPVRAFLLPRPKLSSSPITAGERASATPTATDSDGEAIVQVAQVAHWSPPPKQVPPRFPRPGATAATAREKQERRISKMIEPMESATTLGASARKDDVHTGRPETRATHARTIPEEIPQPARTLAPPRDNGSKPSLLAPSSRRSPSPASRRSPSPPTRSNARSPSPPARSFTPPARSALRPAPASSRPVPEKVPARPAPPTDTAASAPRNRYADFMGSPPTTTNALRPPAPAPARAPRTPSPPARHVARTPSPLPPARSVRRSPSPPPLRVPSPEIRALAKPVRKPSPPATVPAIEARPPPPVRKPSPPPRVPPPETRPALAKSSRKVTAPVRVPSPPVRVPSPEMRAATPPIKISAPTPRSRTPEARPAPAKAASGAPPASSSATARPPPQDSLKVLHSARQPSGEDLRQAMRSTALAANLSTKRDLPPLPRAPPSTPAVPGFSDALMSALARERGPSPARTPSPAAVPTPSPARTPSPAPAPSSFRTPQPDRAASSSRGLSETKGMSSVRAHDAVVQKKPSIGNGLASASARKPVPHLPRHYRSDESLSTNGGYATSPENGAQSVKPSLSGFASTAGFCSDDERSMSAKSQLRAPRSHPPPAFSSGRAYDFIPTKPVPKRGMSDKTILSVTSTIVESTVPPAKESLRVRNPDDEEGRRVLRRPSPPVAYEESALALLSGAPHRTASPDELADSRPGDGCRSDEASTLHDGPWENAVLSPKSKALTFPPPPTDAFEEHVLPSASQLALAADLPVIAASGLRLRFGDLWRKRRTVVLFLRHFWCPADQDYMYSVSRHVNMEALERAGVGLVVIGCGAPGMLRAYRQIFNAPFEFYVDPTLRVYHALGMTLQSNDPGPDTERGAYVRHGPVGGLAMLVLNALRVRMPVFAHAGDATQLGGEMVLGPGYKCSYAHRMRFTRAHAPILSVVAAAGVRPRDMAGPVAPAARLTYSAGLGRPAVTSRKSTKISLAAISQPIPEPEPPVPVVPVTHRPSQTTSRAPASVRQPPAARGPPPDDARAMRAADSEMTMSTRAPRARRKPPLVAERTWTAGTGTGMDTDTAGPGPSAYAYGGARRPFAASTTDAESDVPPPPPPPEKPRRVPARKPVREDAGPAWMEEASTSARRGRSERDGRRAFVGA